MEGFLGYSIKGYYQAKLYIQKASLPVQKSLSGYDEIKYFTAPNIIDLITFLDNDGKGTLYFSSDTHTLYPPLY